MKKGHASAIAQIRFRFFAVVALLNHRFPTERLFLAVGRGRKLAFPSRNLVGVRGFEPPASTSRT